MNHTPFHLHCRVKRQHLHDDVYALGGISVTTLDVQALHQVNLWLCAHGRDPVNGAVQVFYRLLLRQQVYFSSCYGRVRRRNSFTILYKDSSSSSQLGLIRLFLYISPHTMVVVERLQRLAVTCRQHFLLQTDALDLVHLSGVFPVKDSGNIDVISPTDIHSKCIYLDVGTKYVGVFPCASFYMQD